MSEKGEGGLVINLGTQKVWLDGSLLHLSQLEFAVLVCLAIHQDAIGKGRVLSAGTLLKKVWGDGYGENDNRLLYTTMNRLRGKLKETARQPKWIGSFRGRGYWLLRPVKVLEAPPFRVIAQELPDGTLQRVTLR